MRPKRLVIELSKLQQHPQLSVELEQYPTEGDLAAFFVLAIDQLDHLENKHVVDLGAGNGILGIGCTYLGSNKVTMIEGDLEVAELAVKFSQIMTKNNCKIEVIGEMITSDYERQIESVDIVVLNPPWGFQTPKADRPIVDYDSVSTKGCLRYSFCQIQSFCLKLVMILAMTAKLYSKEFFRLP